MVGFRSGKLYRTSLTVDHAGELMARYPFMHLFIDHSFSCYEECSMLPCLGPLCPNK